MNSSLIKFEWCLLLLSTGYIQLLHDLTVATLFAETADIVIIATECVDGHLIRHVS